MAPESSQQAAARASARNPTLRDARMRALRGRSWILNPRKVALWLAGLLVFAYVATTLAAWGFFRFTREYQTIGYWEVALPWRWHEVRLKQGREINRKGLALVRRGEFGQAFFSLRVGVQRDPDNPQARMALAMLFSGAGRLDAAVDTLRRGASRDSATPELVRMLCDHWFADEQLGALIDFAGPFLEREHLAAAVRVPMAHALATALIARRQFADAERLLADARWGAGEAGLHLKVILALERQQWTQALEGVGELIRQRPDEDAYARLQAQILLGAGMRERARAVHLARMLNTWQTPANALTVLEDLHRQGFESDFREELQAFLQRIRRNERLCSLLAASLAVLGEPEAVSSAREASGATGIHGYRFELARIEALLRKRRVEEAASAVDALEKELRETPFDAGPELSVLRAVAAFADPTRLDRSTPWQLFVTEAGRHRALLKRALALSESLNLTALNGRILGLLLEGRGGDALLLRKYLSHLLEVRDSDAFVLALERALLSGSWDATTVERVGALLDSDHFVFLPGRKKLTARVRALDARPEETLDFVGWTPPDFIPPMPGDLFSGADQPR